MNKNKWDLPMLVRIVLVDDFDHFRRSMRDLLELRPEWLVVGEAADGAEGVRLVEQMQPDVVILDIGLPILGGFAASRVIREVSPNTKIIFMSANGTPAFITEAFRLGAQGYIYKQDALELLSAIEAVQHGLRFVSSSLDRRHLENVAD